jgi:hypothetical protein
LIPVDVVAEVLQVGRNSVSRLPLRPLKIGNRKCYRKGDVLDWIEREQIQGNGLLRELRERHRKQMRRSSSPATAAENKRISGEMHSSGAATVDDDEPSPVAALMQVWFHLLARRKRPSVKVIRGVELVIVAAERQKLGASEWSELWDVEIDVMEENGRTGHFPDARGQSLLGRYQHAKRIHFGELGQASPPTPKKT